ncbi:isoleucine--tRNA ligase [bacterium BMS3Bbin02]|nr:isoleucine--tRNA ligase [bacterium BMS3Bbin02]
MTSRSPGQGAQPFKKVNPRLDLSRVDADTLALWKEIGAFQASIDNRADAPEYTFYDGPPFATGSPHYGHLLQAVIKDVVPRYWTMRGFRVERRFGWDTHGLPVEMEVEKQLGVSGPQEIQAIGIDTFNEACRAMVNTTTEEWEDIMDRVGRWVDFENDYKTMDVDFMETVWWVFKELWDRDLIYQAYKVLPYSFGATTPLSNFEANLDYRDVDDPSITVRLRITEDHGPLKAGDFLLVWTTTPWTLPSNLAAAVGENVTYVAVDSLPGGFEGRHWLAPERVEYYAPDANLVATAVGRDMVGAPYEPIFDYFDDKADAGAFRVIINPEVTTDEGTGLVHMAPAYGESDFDAFRAAGIDALVEPLDAKARFTDEVGPELAGLAVKDADSVIIDLLKESGKLVRREQINHSYPFCWRTGTPLIYRAIPTWFVKVESFRDSMVERNRDIRWVPEAVGAKRFGNWLENARDWAISRNRYWGSCIPVWECDVCKETVCIGSRQELFERSGTMVDDLHKHIVDPVTFPCECDGGTMERVPEVLDCWFESGSMPYAQIHYPFENEDRFATRYPADFIAEGLDQTRGWFYTLLVLGTAIFDKAPFQNCIVTGMILAEDGRKMSKSLKNYPNPTGVIDEFGADALRAYLINSPVVRGEPLRFHEQGVRDVVRTVLLPYWNAFSFFSLYADADGLTGDDLAAAPPLSERPEIDRWIVSVLQSLIRDVNDEMERYRLFAVIPPILDFIDHLTNWYIRRSRRRFWRQRTDNDADKLAAFATLHEVLTIFGRVAAPILPFITEDIYQVLERNQDPTVARSIHLTDYPEANESAIDPSLERSMAAVRTVVNLGRRLRRQHDIRVRQPLETITIVSRSGVERRAIEGHAELIKDELNVRSVVVESDEAHLVGLSAKANFKKLGPRFGKDMRSIAAAIEDLDHSEVCVLLAGEPVAVMGHAISPEDVAVQREPRANLVVTTASEITIALDTHVTDELRSEGIARELINRIQGLRRDADLDVSDRVAIAWSTDDPIVAGVVNKHAELIAGECLAVAIQQTEGSLDHELNLDGHSITVSISVHERPDS